MARPSKQSRRQGPPPRRGRSRRREGGGGGLLGVVCRWYRQRNILFRFVLACVAWGSALGLIAVAIVTIRYGMEARKFDLNELGKMPERSLVYDTQGRTLGRLHGANRIIIPLDAVSGHFINALLAREDKSFYQHHGIDYYGLCRAVVRNVKDRSFVQGASTLTMQLARNSFEMREKTLHRKLVEIMLARRIEGYCGKERILELYVNRIFFGTGLYGVERASQAYFGKTARELNLSESALLAGIIRSPNRFSPFRNLKGALSERDTVLGRMVTLGYINEAAAEVARTTKIVTADQTPLGFQENYAMDAVRRDLDIVLDADHVEDGGLRIHTTLDVNVQRAAEMSLEKHLADVEKKPGYRHQTMASFASTYDRAKEVPPKYLQGSVVALDNRTGGILAVVGGRRYAHSKYNRALHARRQIGSVFKPFVYASAYEHGQLLPDVLVNDARIGPRELGPHHGNWSPENSDKTYQGYLPASVGLIRSRNTMSARVGSRARLTNVLDLARRSGLADDAIESPVVFLGAFETTAKAITSAYSIFPNGGIRKRPFLISRIETSSGQVVYTSGPLAYGVMAPGAAALVNQSLEQVMRKGTGSRSGRMGWTAPSGGKTGTTNDFRDAWFVGYSNRVSCGVWVGLDTPKRIVAGGYGATLALPIWVDVMKEADKGGYKAVALPQGPQRIPRTVCKISGGFATASCESHGSAFRSPIPIDLADQRQPCHIHRGPVRRAPVARPANSPGILGRLRNIFR